MFEVLSAPGEICGHPAAQLSYIGSAEGQQMEYMCDLSNFLHTVGALAAYSFPRGLSWTLHFRSTIRTAGGAPAPYEATYHGKVSFTLCMQCGAVSMWEIVHGGPIWQKGITRAQPLNLLRAGGTSLCDLAAQWIDVGRRGGGGNVGWLQCNLEGRPSGHGPRSEVDSVDNCRLDSLAHFRDAAGFISVEPSFSDWDDGFEQEVPRAFGEPTRATSQAPKLDFLGHEKGLCRALQGFAGLQGKWNGGLVPKGITLIPLKEPSEENRSARVKVRCGIKGLPRGIPVCSLIAKAEMDNAESYRDGVARCFKESANFHLCMEAPKPFSEVPCVPRTPAMIHHLEKCPSYSSLNMQKLLVYQSGARDEAFARPLPSKTSGGSSFLAAVGPGVGRGDNSAKLEAALSVLHRFDVVDVSFAPNESGVLLQDAMRSFRMSHLLVSDLSVSAFDSAILVSANGKQGFRDWLKYQAQGYASPGMSIRIRSFRQLLTAACPIMFRFAYTDSAVPSCSAALLRPHFSCLICEAGRWSSAVVDRCATPQGLRIDRPSPVLGCPYLLTALEELEVNIMEGVDRLVFRQLPIFFGQDAALAPEPFRLLNFDVLASPGTAGEGTKLYLEWDPPWGEQDVHLSISDLLRFEARNQLDRSLVAAAQSLILERYSRIRQTGKRARLGAAFQHKLLRLLPVAPAGNLFAPCLKECILSGLLSVHGKKVLHLDRNPYYGGECASLNITNLWQKFMPGSAPPKELGENREWNVDLIPKFIMASGDLVKILLKTKVSRYLEWKSCEGTYVYQYQEAGLFSGAKYIHKVPASAGDGLKSPLMGMLEKPRFINFAQFIMNWEDDKPSTHQDIDPRRHTMAQVYQKFGLQESTIDFIGHAVALWPNDSYLNGPCGPTIQKCRLYLQSVLQYGGSPFIYPIYGLGGLPEGFSRLAAIHRGTYMHLGSSHGL
ncbi:GDI2 [Symbiodinium natans]|uniref:GDI2 protein n=1 Tax=Symbiodinium natans TaxID=878477 RepID=A0A812J9M5_9DINO|nr:GDI2 [Symbiodinium natans]